MKSHWTCSDTRQSQGRNISRRPDHPRPSSRLGDVGAIRSDHGMRIHGVSGGTDRTNRTTDITSEGDKTVVDNWHYGHLIIKVGLHFHSRANTADNLRTGYVIAGNVGKYRKRNATYTNLLSPSGVVRTSQRLGRLLLRGTIPLQDRSGPLDVWRPFKGK